jgi:hypothetical protein
MRGAGVRHMRFDAPYKQKTKGTALRYPHTQPKPIGDPTCGGHQPKSKQARFPIHVRGFRGPAVAAKGRAHGIGGQFPRISPTCLPFAYHEWQRPEDFQLIFNKPLILLVPVAGVEPATY